jgi:L-lactate dehydrogenase complex protein LldF
VTPQLQSMEHGKSLPFASSLCGACYDVCPVKINIPDVLIHLRGKVVSEQQTHVQGRLQPENLAMKLAAHIFADARRFEGAQRLARIGQWPFVSENMIGRLPGILSGWTAVRDLRPIPKQSFRQWWRKRKREVSANGNA